MRDFGLIGPVRSIPRHRRSVDSGSRQDEAPAAASAHSATPDAIIATSAPTNGRWPPCPTSPPRWQCRPSSAEEKSDSARAVTQRGAEANCTETLNRAIVRILAAHRPGTSPAQVSEHRPAEAHVSDQREAGRQPPSIRVDRLRCPSRSRHPADHQGPGDRADAAGAQQQAIGAGVPAQQDLGHQRSQAPSPKRPTSPKMKARTNTVRIGPE
jgi:hypothetical protein